MNATQFKQAVLRWFDQQGRHNLPWQHNPTPYRVWISEIMLQQTQVNTVIPYFEKFMQSFPNVKTLAQAKLDAVLAHWSGLGYYARARYLHHSAQLIIAQYGNHFPKTMEELVALPGIGQSTAGAILSLGMQIPATILDGNVKRLLSRFYAVTQPLNNTQAIKNLWDLARQTTPKKHCAAYNQAVMDLGAMICTRAKPKCNLCPLQKGCQAFKQGNPTSYPIKINKKPSPTKDICMLILQNTQGEIFLEKRPPTGIWGGLWSLPECPLEENVVQWTQLNLHLKGKLVDRWPVLQHQFTHFTLNIHPCLLRVNSGLKAMNFDQHIWYKKNNPLPGGIPAPISKLLQSFF